jgi:UPF0755 protein
MKKNLFIFLVISPIFAISLAAVRVYYVIYHSKYEGPDISFVVKSGEGFSSINGRLGQKEIISNTRIFHRYTQANGFMTKFKKGDYIIPSSSTMEDIAGILISGKGKTISVTIPEGKNLFEIAGILLQKKVLRSTSDFIKLAKDSGVANSYKVSGKRLEGYLYPNTYRFTKYSSAKDIISTMVNEFYKRTKELDFSHPKLSKHELIILASIVEKETGRAIERPRIAGVFFNRLRKRMRIQSDPTTIYGIWENFNGNLRKKHLLAKTPYNTYKISGLPIGPISNPGLKAIEAVLQPESHQFLYFVSKNDGSHVFSKNLIDHNKAVNFWQKNAHNRKGRSWRKQKKK